MVGLGQVPNDTQSVIGKDALNLLLDEWDGEGLALPPFDASITFNTVGAQARYLLGPGSGAANTVRPETIIVGTCTIAGSPTTNTVMSEMPFPSYQMIAVPSTSGQPWNYAVNPTYPQMEVFLYPTPSAVYPITLTCKVKWVATVGEPDLNPFTEAEVPSGYPTALVDNLALKIAENYQLETATLVNKARNGKATIGFYVGNQNSKAKNTGLPTGLFSWNILTAGRNP
jgi:hypothetical protein